MAVLAWTLVPLVVLHLAMAVRWRSLLACQLLLDLLLAAVVGPALIVGGDLNPVRCLSRNEPFTAWEWAPETELEPTQSDLVLQFHPWWEEARRQLLAGSLPLVAPHLGGGLPLLANGQIGLLAPVMAPVWALGPERGTTVMAWWKIELAGLGAFLLCARGLRAGPWSACLGAVLVAGSGYQIGWLLVPLGWVSAAMPWLWWLMIRVGRGPWRWRRTVATGALAGWLLGCGLHPETAAVVVGSALLALAVLHPRRIGRGLVVLVVALVVAVALAWPTLVYLASSARVRQAAAERPNLEPLPVSVRLLGARQLLLAKLHGQPSRGDWWPPFPMPVAASGVGCVALALVAVGRVDRRRRRLLLAAAANLAVVAVMVYRVPPLDWVLVRLPPFDRMTLARFQVLAPFSLALLAVLAADALRRGRLHRRWAWWLPAAVLTAVAATAWPWPLAPVNAAIVVASLVVAWLAPLLRRYPALLAAAAAVEVAILAVGVNPVAAAVDRTPRPELVRRLEALAAGADERVIGTGGMFPANLASRYRISDLRSYDPVRPWPYVDLLAHLGQPDPVLGGPLGAAPPGLCGAFAVRYLVTAGEAAAPGWDELWSGPDARLWSNPRWLPELRLVGAAVVADGAEGWALLTGDALDLAFTAVVPPPFAPLASLGGELEVLARKPARVVARVRSEGATLLVVGRPWAPGWRARVDGRPAAVVRANLAGLGVRVPPGDHVVELRYAAWSGLG